MAPCPAGTPTPVASIIIGLLIVILSAVYYLVTSVQNAFFDVTGLLFSILYILTALTAIAYYRRRVVSSAFDLVTVGLLPLGAGFLAWIFDKSLGEAPWSQRWSLIGIVLTGLVLLLIARFVLHSSFFRLPRESEEVKGHGRPGGPDRNGTTGQSGPPRARILSFLAAMMAGQA